MSNDRKIEELLTTIEQDPTNEEALGELAALYEQEQRWKVLAAVYEMQIELTTEVNKLIDLHQKLAVVYEEKLANPHRAYTQWRKILDLDPHHKLAVTKAAN